MMFGNAEAYDRFMGRWSRVLAPLLVDFAGVPDAGRVLEIGSGIGTLAFEIAKRETGRQVTGIDPSNEFVAYAISQNAFPDRTSFHVGDAQDLHFADATFVAALSLLVFNFIPDPEKALRETCRVTKRGGRITAAVWDYGDEMRMLRAFWDAAAEVDPRAEKVDEKHMPLCRASELSQLWKQAGLEEVHEQPLDITMSFDSFSDYWEPFLLGQGPAGAYVRSVDTDRLAMLRNTVKRRLPLSSENDAFALHARVWAVRGTVPGGGA
ncbi:MAG TPA: methyltransferase domain-containing protein [Terriglobia bacterium]|nr:methyltransferase domain-containing protein [Terriglobia bacterium]